MRQNVFVAGSDTAGELTALPRSLVGFGEKKWGRVWG